MTFKDPAQGAAAIVFLFVFTALVCVSAHAFTTRRPRLRLFSILFYSILKLGAQVAGVGWAVALYTNFNWLIAYLVLGAEGYFALIICTFFTIVAYEVQYFGNSWLAPEKPTELRGRKKRLHFLTTPSFWVHQAIIPANVLIVIGGTQLSSKVAKSNVSDLRNVPGAQESMNLRTAGQALFLAATCLCYILAFITFRKAKRNGSDATLILMILATTPFMLVRGAYGVISAASYNWSYYNSANYGSHGLKPRQLVGEYVMGTTMECVTAIVLLVVNLRLTRPRTHAAAPEESAQEAVSVETK